MTDPDVDYVRIFDTTLRDGEQSPGASMTTPQKLEVARALARLGVDVIESGFPAASPDDFMAVRKIAETIGLKSVEGRPSNEPPSICALARANQPDIDRAWEAIREAKHPRIHTFLATSELHMSHKLRMTRKEVLARVGEMVAYARERCSDVEFSPEDAGRSDPEFLWQVLEVAIKAGATTLNIPDTVGYTTPDEFFQMIAGIRKNVRGIEHAVISVHCHDDLGLATSNTLAGLRAGARQCEVTMNGIGERAGNCSLEEVVMALRTRPRVFGLRTGIDTTQLVRASRLVSTCTGIVVQPNKAIVGANAFAHESGIHQDGMLKHEETYEIMRPETVGAGQTELVLGKHSGRHALGARLALLGMPVEGGALDRAFQRFKQVADKKKVVTDADLESLMQDELSSAERAFTLEAVEVRCGTSGGPAAKVALRGPDGRVHTEESTGTGPVDAAYRAVDRIVETPSTLLEYRVHAVTEGIDAVGEVSVRVRGDGDAVHPQLDARPRTFHGHGADTDIIVASVKAYLAAMNGLYASRGAHSSKARQEEPRDGTHAV
jgi:2-isopropylmalate synthase